MYVCVEKEINFSLIFNSLFILNPRLNHNEKPQVLSLELFETMRVIFLFKWFKVSFYLSEKSKGKKERQESRSRLSISIVKAFFYTHLGLGANIRAFIEEINILYFYHHLYKSVLSVSHSRHLQRFLKKLLITSNDPPSHCSTHNFKILHTNQTVVGKLSNKLQFIRTSFLRPQLFSRPTIRIFVNFYKTFFLRNYRNFVRN